eukprot:TRINITY_DN8228_c0_g1_i1.p1 TRINITY_DN8228_c0_g1~~TRINITY_DN8228_c0_g1_i1.p1  ORF type:complete len:394 (-),score=105.83 TRINITY_DN8228_c0_g1_i1:30-1181(-)
MEEQERARARERLRRLLAHGLCRPLVVYGPRGAGKTTGVRRVLEEVAWAHAYLSCCNLSLGADSAVALQQFHTQVSEWISCVRNTCELRPNSPSPETPLVVVLDDAELLPVDLLEGVLKAPPTSRCFLLILNGDWREHLMGTTDYYLASALHLAFPSHVSGDYITAQKNILTMLDVEKGSPQEMSVKKWITSSVDLDSLQLAQDATAGGENLTDLVINHTRQPVELQASSLPELARRVLVVAYVLTHTTQLQLEKMIGVKVSKRKATPTTQTEVTKRMFSLHEFSRYFATLFPSPPPEGCSRRWHSRLGDSTAPAPLLAPQLLSLVRAGHLRNGAGGAKAKASAAGDGVTARRGCWECSLPYSEAKLIARSLDIRLDDLLPLA